MRIGRLQLCHLGGVKILTSARDARASSTRPTRTRPAVLAGSAGQRYHATPGSPQGGIAARHAKNGSPAHTAVAIVVALYPTNPVGRPGSPSTPGDALHFAPDRRSIRPQSSAHCGCALGAEMAASLHPTPAIRVSDRNRDAMPQKRRGIGSFRPGACGHSTTHRYDKGHRCRRAVPLDRRSGDESSGHRGGVPHSRTYLCPIPQHTHNEDTSSSGNCCPPPDGDGFIAACWHRGDENIIRDSDQTIPGEGVVSHQVLERHLAPV